MPTSYTQKQLFHIHEKGRRERLVQKVVYELWLGIAEGYEDECIDVNEVARWLEPKVYGDEDLDWTNDELVRDRRQRQYR